MKIGDHIVQTGERTRTFGQWDADNEELSGDGSAVSFVLVPEGPHIARIDIKVRTIRKV